MLEADVELDRREFRLSAAFAVRAGERLALFGPSGAGKTTILEIIAGLLPPARGTVALDGRVLTRTAAPRRQVPPWQRRVGLLRQDPALFPHLSVRQNLGYAARAAHGPEGTGRDEITRIAERLGIGGLLDDRPARLSGGQAHRVALGRLLASQCDALLLDEPYTGLDASLRRDLTDLVRDLVVARQVPSVLVAHELEAAQAFADQMAVLDSGTILQTGPAGRGGGGARHPPGGRAGRLPELRAAGGPARGRGGRGAPGPCGGGPGPGPGRGAGRPGPVLPPVRGRLGGHHRNGQCWRGPDARPRPAARGARRRPGVRAHGARAALLRPRWAAGQPSRRGTHVKLRVLRQARGYSQQQLAGMAGVSRQAVSAVEAGHSDPSLRVALALASALGVTVEELFGPGIPAPVIGARPVAPLGGEGARVTLAQVGESHVALPLAADSAIRAGFLPAGGLVAMPSGPAPATPVRPLGPPRPTLVVAGCDPALPLLETPLALLDPPVAFSWWPCSSAEALRLAEAGLVHAAGAHLLGSSGEYNTGPARQQLARGGAEVIGFASWREGLVLRPGLEGSVHGLSDLAERGLRLVNREAGSEARRVLDREMGRAGLEPAALRGYGTRATGHLQVASATAAGLADAGVASEPAALAYGLGFVPLAEERFDLVIPASQAGLREVDALLKVLSSPWLAAQLASLPGYDPSRCGEHVATL